MSLAQLSLFDVTPLKERGGEARAFKFIDLFCGIGGMRLGMESAGFRCVFSCDINEECRKTYQANFEEIPEGDIAHISEKSIPDFDVLCAGFPCQPFSISGKQKGFEDTRGTLFFEICRIVQEKQPQIIFLENVKHLIHHDEGRTLEIMLERLASLGYIVSWQLLNALDYGVPQNRERIIIIASKRGCFNFSLMEKTSRRILLDFIDSEGAFEYLDENDYTLIENPKIQKQSGLYFAGYRNKSIRKAGVRPDTKHLSRVHKQPNRIYSVYGTHPTLPSQETSGRFWILLQDRRVRKLTIDECFRLMGFPDNFARPSSLGEQYKQIGNSICVPMVAAIADALKQQYFSEWGSDVNDTHKVVAANL